MEKFHLSLLYKIIGIGSASGLFYHDNSLFIISDNSTFLYYYQIESNTLTKIPLIEDGQENIIKKQKPDFESITYYKNSLYLFGSGSTENRNKMIEVATTTKQVVASNDLTNLYLSMQSFGEIKPEDFNLEGAICNGESWYLFNRGNGISNKNVVFTVKGKNLANEFSLVVNTIKLPKIKGIHASFTDAIMVEDKIYFLATAEDTESTYDDGEVLGSIIGRIDIKTMKIDFTKKITNKMKFEGLTLFYKNDKQIAFLLCEDNDTDLLESGIYKLSLDINK
jgi:hypothetical protein